MFGWKKWIHLLLTSLLLALATLVSMATLAGAGQITLVDDEEGVLVLGGQAQSGCSPYGSNIVYCTANNTCADGSKCPNLTTLVSGTGVNAKNVGACANAACQACGQSYKNGYCAGNLSVTPFDQCTP
jgi:hypothetical protein